MWVANTGSHEGATFAGMDISRVVEAPGKALAAADLGDGLACYVYFDMANEAVPLPKEIIFGSRLDDVTLIDLLHKWEPPASPAISSAHLRAVNLGEVAREVLLIQAQSKKASVMAEGDFPIVIAQADVSGASPAQVAGFRSATDMAAAVDRVNASIVYASATQQGERKPVQVVADRLFSGDISKARNVVAQARKKGYLIGGSQGRPGGTLSESARSMASLLGKVAGSHEQGG